nr:MAG TPA: hypothetical protein [Caudoviricetes sp.]DAS02781.1 MAG TPA: hypothetical protein [Caudoviricetes sp.]
MRSLTGWPQTDAPPHNQGGTGKPAPDRPKRFAASVRNRPTVRLAGRPCQMRL